jgi:hypothetical protein
MPAVVAGIVGAMAMLVRAEVRGLTSIPEPLPQSPADLECRTRAIRVRLVPPHADRFVVVSRNVTSTVHAALRVRKQTSRTWLTGDPLASR